MDNDLRVFVYGSLKPGEMNDWLYSESVVEEQPAIAHGQLYALPLGYPALILTPNLANLVTSSPHHPITPPSLVHGFLLSFANSEILPVLDEFEQHDPAALERHAPGQAWEQNQYDRKLIQVFDQNQLLLGLAWTYTMTTEQVTRLGGILLLDGNWNSEQQRSAFSGSWFQHLG